MLLAAPGRADERDRFVPVSGDRPAFTLPGLAGTLRSLGDLRTSRGRTLLVHFFATWCEPCREELPALRRLAARSETVSIVTISVAEVPLRVQRFIATTPVSFPVLLDQDRAIARSWGVDALPSAFVLDAGLRPRRAVMRDFDWDRLDAAALERMSQQSANGGE